MSEDASRLSGAGTEAFREDAVSDMFAEIRRFQMRLSVQGPMLGAIIVCDWWRNGGLCLKVLPGEVEDWTALAGLIGDEGVEIATRHEGRAVFIVGGKDFDATFPPTPNPDASTVFGTPVYRLAGPPKLKPLFDWEPLPDLDMSWHGDRWLWLRP